MRARAHVHVHIVYVRRLPGDWETQNRHDAHPSLDDRVLLALWPKECRAHNRQHRT